MAAVQEPDRRVSEVPKKTALNGENQQTSNYIIQMDETGDHRKKSDTTSTVKSGAEPADGKINNQLVNETETSKKTTNEVGESKDIAGKGGQPGKTPPTREEIEAMKKEVISIIETHISQMKDVDWLDENGKYVEGASKLVHGFSLSYFALKSGTLEDMIESRRQIANVCLQTDILTKVCGIVIDIYPKGWATEDKKTDLNIWNVLKNALLFILNFSDASHPFAERIANTPGFLEMIRQILIESVEPHLKQDQPVRFLSLLPQ